MSENPMSTHVIAMSAMAGPPEAPSQSMITGPAAGTWCTRPCSRASSRAWAPIVQGRRPSAWSMLGPTARSITRSLPATSNTAGTGTPDARASVITAASASSQRGSRPSR